MKTRIFQIIALTIAACAFATNAAETNPPPAISIVQFSEYSPGRRVRFPSGLVIALWSDGRMVRAQGSNTVDVSYVECFVNAIERDKLSAFINESSLLKGPPTFLVPVDAPFKEIVIYRNGKRSVWGKELPYQSGDLYELEARLWKLPLERVHPIDLKAARAVLRLTGAP